MPLRAFLLFGPVFGVRHQRAGVNRFNALAGIFAFWTHDNKALLYRITPEFQCPCGHFCFLDVSPLVAGEGGSMCVSMPLRAFLLFGPIMVAVDDKDIDVSFNALAGIFAFWTRIRRALRARAPQFQCPCGHFCFLDAGMESPAGAA